MSAIRMEQVSKAYGGYKALTDVTISIASGERRAVIGPNGAGKSTLFSILAGQKSLTSGEIFLDDEAIAGRRPDELWARGLTRTFQRNQLFAKLTVQENVELACAAHHRGFLTRRRSRTILDEEIDAVLRAVGLGQRADIRAGGMAYGEQRQLELALALAGRPKILLLDEPTAGMSPAETEQMLRLMCDLPRSVTLLIVEHDMDVVFSLADRVTVLNLGEVLADGTVAEIRSNSHVDAIYMGKTP